MHCFEDMGFFCSDNVPTVLIPELLRVLRERSDEIPRVVVVADVRERAFLKEFVPMIKELRGLTPRPEVVYLEASEEVLLRRFKETKRPHPLALESRAEDGIRQEKALMGEVRDVADMIIDTSNFNNYQLREHLQTRFEAGNRLVVSVCSFGYKYGIPLDSDLVFDVRFLRNPYYIPALRRKTGEHEDVDRYVFEDPEAASFFKSLSSFVRRMIPRYIREGKAYLNISIGCTGGHHR
ncbi:MAG: RNase adapter RapZ, partial [Planctomycetota bacterium]